MYDDNNVDFENEHFITGFSFTTGGAPVTGPDPSIFNPVLFGIAIHPSSRATDQRVTPLFRKHPDHRAQNTTPASCSKFHESNKKTNTKSEKKSHKRSREKTSEDAPPT